MSTVARPPYRPQPPPIRRRARSVPAPAWWRRVRRVLLLGVAFALVPAGVSYLQVLVSSSNASLGIRSVEWLRDHGASRLVSDVENWYYSLTAPAKGGPALRSLPGVGATQSAVATAPGARVVHYYRPPAIQPVIQPALPGEGVWRPAMANAGPRPPVLVTTYRGEADYPRLVTGVAWIDQGATSFSYFPGALEPPVPINRGPEEIPPSLRRNLVATFNGGFKLHDAGEGYAYQGHTWAPMLKDIGTLVKYRDGRVDVISWQGGPTAGPDILLARQNLPLIVNHGRLNPNLSDGLEWGATVANAIRVWRSGLGIDRRGDLIYVAANNQTVRTLAQSMLRAGAVRALELDINEFWTSFITYGRHYAKSPSNLLPNMVRPATRYLTPDDRDFFAIFAR
jgi:hypothetical protein